MQKRIYNFETQENNKVNETKYWKSNHARLLGLYKSISCAGKKDIGEQNIGEKICNNFLNKKLSYFYGLNILKLYRDNKDTIMHET